MACCAWNVGIWDDEWSVDPSARCGGETGSKLLSRYQINLSYPIFAEGKKSIMRVSAASNSTPDNSILPNSLSKAPGVQKTPFARNIYQEPVHRQSQAVRQSIFIFRWSTQDRIQKHPSSPIEKKARKNRTTQTKNSRYFPFRFHSYTVQDMRHSPARVVSASVNTKCKTGKKQIYMHTNKAKKQIFLFPTKMK